MDKSKKRPTVSETDEFIIWEVENAEWIYNKNYIPYATKEKRDQFFFDLTERYNDKFNTNKSVAYISNRWKYIRDTTVAYSRNKASGDPEKNTVAMRAIFERCQLFLYSHINHRNIDKVYIPLPSSDNWEDDLPKESIYDLLKKAENEESINVPENNIHEDGSTVIISDEEYQLECLDEFKDIVEFIARQKGTKDMNNEQLNQDMRNQVLDTTRSGEHVNHVLDDTSAEHVNQDVSNNEQDVKKAVIKQSGEETANPNPVEKIDFNFPKKSVKEEKEEEKEKEQNDITLCVNQIQQSIKLQENMNVLMAKVSILAEGIEALPEKKKRLALRKITNVIRQFL